MVVYEIDGEDFATLEEFYDEISRLLIPGAAWGRNLDAFNDILRGGFGTADDGFTLRWKNHHVSRERLGYAETVRQLELRLQKCDPLNRERVGCQLERARDSEGPTTFDWLIEILHRHGDGGDEEADSVILELA